jgi:hypothetical protein
MYPNQSNFWGKLEPHIKVCLGGPMETRLKPVPQKCNSPTEHPSFHILSYNFLPHGKNSHKSIKTQKSGMILMIMQKPNLKRTTFYFFGGE